jgi:hypothetical protein
MEQTHIEPEQPSEPPQGTESLPPSMAMLKPKPPKLYRVGEVVDYSGMSRQTIHNYTTMGLIRESQWTRGGHRVYDESVFERLDVIARMRADKMPLDLIRERLAGAPDG